MKFVSALFLSLCLLPVSGAEFRKVILVEDCFDPITVEVAPDGRVIFIERAGKLRIWSPQTKRTVLGAQMDVFFEYNGSKNGGWEDGLIGMVLDPKFQKNHWIYLYYSPKAVSENWVSRFTLKGNTIDLASEKVLLKVAIQRDVCCHSAGGMAFDGEGRLYVSTGDNTNPFQSNGYAPIDHREGRYGFDASRSSANRNDLRGKILRIKPNDDGTMSLPDGNLFPSDGSKGRPEIFTMGHRNPFRISVDPATGWLYCGEVGPDSRLFNKERGPAGFDELNRTKEAGNFGWPFFIGNNTPYRAFDFASNKSGELFDKTKPMNLSPNNTGLKALPPAKPAWIYYPYSPSARFRELGSGPRTACAGPVYHFDAAVTSPHKLPKRFDKSLFIYEWARHWIKEIRFDDKGGIAAIKPVAANLKFKRPVDLKIGPDGCLYLVEFGTAWEKNTDSQIVRLEYLH